MGKVFWHVTMSLDGFIAGPNDAMDWVFGYIPLDAPATRAMLEEVIRTTGSVLSGRRSYNVGRKPGQRPEARKVLGGAWSGPVFVLTHRAPEDEEDASIQFVSGGIRSAVGVARNAGGGKNVMVIGAGVARQCIEEGLIDEIRVYLAPILLGDGVRFFNRPGATDGVRLETMEVARTGQLADLYYRVVK
ncbi:MAG TPA: dihydrofolate reductase family protein [Candidatus Acidoferrales bacterium]|jgi:dihydrofolate reductase|nr:dihydrofolate reductase family protein [Candidatus Acidoferrales bacterium]